jgi:hypothetical protein
MGHVPVSTNLAICKLLIVDMFFSRMKGLVYPVMYNYEMQLSRQFLISVLPSGL